MTELPETRYAKSGDVHIAYQVLGHGTLDLVVVPGIVSHVEFLHEVPGYSRFISGLGAFARIITFDKRGNGLSDRVSGVPSLEERMDDVRAVMDTVGSERAALLGISEGASMCTLFAVTYPARTIALVLCGGSARYVDAPGYPFGINQASMDWMRGPLIEAWGTGASLVMFGPSMADDAEARSIWAKLERLSATPGSMRAALEANEALDCRHILPIIRVPTLVLCRADELLASASTYLAEHIPGGRVVALPGADHYPFFGDADAVVAEIEEFLTGERHAVVEEERILATVAIRRHCGLHEEGC